MGYRIDAPVESDNGFTNKTTSDGRLTQPHYCFSSRNTRTFWWTIEGTKENG